MAARKHSQGVVVRSAASAARGGAFEVPVGRDVSAPGVANVDFSEAPAPKRVFCADGFSIKKIFDQYRLIFLQRGIDGKKIRSMLELRMNPHPFANLKDNFPDVPENLEIPFEYWLEDFEEPEQTVAFEVTFIRISAMKSSTNFDFYYVSGLGMHEFRKRDTLPAIDIVSVQFPNMMFPLIVKKLRELLDANNLGGDDE